MADFYLLQRSMADAAVFLWLTFRNPHYYVRTPVPGEQGSVFEISWHMGSSTLNDSAPAKDEKQPDRRKPPIWPWVLLLILLLAGIYAHHQVSLIMEDFGRTGSDFVQLFEWLWSLVEAD